MYDLHYVWGCSRRSSPLLSLLVVFGFVMADSRESTFSVDLNALLSVRVWVLFAQFFETVMASSSCIVEFSEDLEVPWVLEGLASISLLPSTRNTF